MKNFGFWCFFGHRRVLGLVALAALAGSGCAKLEDRARLYLASSVDVFAVVGKQLLMGEAQLYSDRTGTIALSTGLSTQPPLNCSGRLSRTGSTEAALDLRCSDGSSLSLSAAMLAETQGYAYGQSSTGTAASLTLGLASARAVAYLRAPAGQQLLALPKKPFMELN
ncbi:MAG: hypothetical protein CFE43_08620 [Burkholderiales bacterium PBB3]|nr:MAG: hypothetical protein CFE43_08620 [Burkholderiales bacterium PBB3]